MTDIVDKSSTFEECDPKEATRISKTVLDETVALEVVANTTEQLSKLGINGLTLTAKGKDVIVSSSECPIQKTRAFVWHMLGGGQYQTFEKEVNGG